GRAVAEPLGDLGQGQADRSHPFGQVSRHFLPPLRPPPPTGTRPRRRALFIVGPMSELALLSKPVG
ncbi:MAG TPA: hypothetical protein VK284_06090, partial [Streptosporangiaceae bacterium]|nr:hypothetical protein [Streptosporangiaceae bacterium]